MLINPPLLTVTSAAFDRRSGLSVLVVEHVHAKRRLALLFHDAATLAASRPLLAVVAATLRGRLAPGQGLGMVESSLPDHPREPFLYARVGAPAATGQARRGVTVGPLLSGAMVAELCGITTQELRRTEELAVAMYESRRCAFAGFPQLDLVEPDRGDLAAPGPARPGGDGAARVAA